MTTLVVSNFFVWVFVFAEDRDGEMRVSFLDVGQGDAIFIDAPNGNQILIDSGRGSGVLKELSQVMPFYDRTIDMIIETHPDSDHIGGFPSVLKSYKVSSYMHPGKESDSAAYAAFQKGIEREGTENILARRGMKVVLDEDIYLDILFPERETSFTDANEASIIAKLTYSEVDFMLTGDASKYTENIVLSLDGEKLDSEVLKVSHHGSKTSSSRNFVAAVSPDFSIISTEENSRYGHPHKEVLDTLNNAGSKILSTSEEGTITFVTDGEMLRLD